MTVLARSFTCLIHYTAATPKREDLSRSRTRRRVHCTANVGKLAQQQGSTPHHFPMHLPSSILRPHAIHQHELGLAQSPEYPRAFIKTAARHRVARLTCYHMSDMTRLAHVNFGTLALTRGSGNRGKYAASHPSTCHYCVADVYHNSRLARCIHTPRAIVVSLHPRVHQCSVRLTQTPGVRASTMTQRIAMHSGTDLVSLLEMKPQYFFLISIIWIHRRYTQR